MSRPTLRTLAIAAGVHHTTLSRALRNDPRIPESTRTRLQNLAKEAGYRPDALVTRCMTALQRGKSGRDLEALGLLTSRTRLGEGEGPFRAFCRHIALRADELGYRIEEIWAGEPGLTVARIDKMIMARGIEGLIIPPDFQVPGGHLRLDLTHLATVLHSHAVWRPQLHRVEAHNFQNMLLVMKALYHRGYRRIGLMLFMNLAEITGHEWEGAYHYYHQRHRDLEKVPVFFSKVFDDPALLKWVKLERPEVIVGTFPYHPEIFRKEGFRVPEDLGCVSMGVYPWDPPSAGLDMRAEEIDRAAVDVVVAQINRHEKGVPKTPRDILIEGVWHEGPTVRPARASRHA